MVPGRRDRARTMRTGAVAVLFFAAALLFSPRLYGAVRARGVPQWLQGAVETSLSSVWKEITPEGKRYSQQEALSLLSAVAERVFAGYAVEGASYEKGTLAVALAPKETTVWDVEILVPKLSPPLDGWFAESLEGAEGEIADIMEGVPLEALSWADIPLKDTMQGLFALRTPGWAPALLVKLREEGATLQVSFVPTPPFVLAVVPEVFSSTLPLIFRSDMKEDIFVSLSPLVGLPVKWAAKNRERIERLAASDLESGNTATHAKIEARVTFTPAQLASTNAVVESDRYVVRAWMAAYVGADDRYPEVGLHLGRKFLLTSGFPMELYGEWIMSVNDFSLESRWGIRWSPWKNVQLGAEQVFPGNETWFRLWVYGGIRQPYFWWRVSEHGDHNLGVGYRLTGHISIEIHYDDRDDDTISLRAIGDL